MDTTTTPTTAPVRTARRTRAANRNATSIRNARSAKRTGTTRKRAYTRRIQPESGLGDIVSFFSGLPADAVVNVSYGRTSIAVSSRHFMGGKTGR